MITDKADGQRKHGVPEQFQRRKKLNGTFLHMHKRAVYSDDIAPGFFHKGQGNVPQKGAWGPN